MTDLQAAAERLRNEDYNDRCTVTTSFGRLGDVHALADRMLRELDPTPVDGAWLEAIGWTKIGDEAVGYVYHSPASEHCGPMCRLTCDEVMDCDAWEIGWFNLTANIPPLATRGAVLSMCRVLGIPLTEEKKS